MTAQAIDNVPFRLGIVGHGKWPSNHLLPGAKQLEDLTVVAVCGRDEARASAFALAHGIPHSYVDIDRMLAAENLDGIIIATPPGEHEAAVRAAASAGVAAMCEKPLALDLDGAARIRDLMTGLPALTGFTLRWHPLFRELRSVITSGVAGRVQHVRIRYLQSSAATALRPWGWHFDADAEPLGVVSDLGPHAVDLVRWLLGDITEVTAFLRTTIHERSDDTGPRPVTNADDADVYLSTVTGTTAALTISRVSPDIGVAGGITIEVLTDAGWIRVDSNEPDVVFGTVDGTRRVPVPVTSFHVHAPDQIGEFAAAVRGKAREDLPTIDDGYQAQRVLDAIAESAVRRATVALA